MILIILMKTHDMSKIDFLNYTSFAFEKWSKIEACFLKYFYFFPMKIYS